VASWLRPRAVWLVPIGVALALVTMGVVPQTAGLLTTYSSATPAAAVLDVAAGAGLLAAGTALVLSGVRPDLGSIAFLAGVAWLAADWIGWAGGPAVVRTVAMGLVLFFLPLVLYLLVLVESREASLVRRRVVATAYVGAAAITATGLLFRDPRLDLYCWSNCGVDVLLIGNVPAVGTMLRWAVPAFEVAMAAAIVALAGMTLARGTTRRQHAATGAAIAALFVGVTSAAHGGALLVDAHEGPRFATHVALFELRAASTALLAATLGWMVIRAWRGRLAILRLASDLGGAPQPGGLESALASVARDPTLGFLYWLPHPGHFVDASGRQRDVPEQNERRAVTSVGYRGRQIGVAVHDPTSIDPAELERLLGPAARLALENERLRAELLAKLDDVRASRARIVAAADAARARLERDLHDGAQQGLLAVVHAVQVAADLAAIDGDETAVEKLRAALRDANTIVTELREIAQGIFPEVLAERGLGPALRTLADTARIPVEIVDAPVGRLPEAAERAGYAVIAVAIDAAADAGVAALTVRSGQTDDRLTFEIEGLGASEVPGIADRVSAANGWWSVNDRLVNVWIPCA